MNKFLIAAFVTTVAAAAAGIYFAKKNKEQSDASKFDDFDKVKKCNRAEDCDYASVDDDGVPCVYNADVTCRLAADGLAACDKGESLKDMSEVLKHYGSELKKDGIALGEHLMECAKELLNVEEAELPNQVNTVKAGVAGVYIKLKDGAQDVLEKCHVTEEAQKEARDKLTNAIDEFNKWIHDLAGEKKCGCDDICCVECTGDCSNCSCDANIPVYEGDEFAEETDELLKKTAEEPADGVEIDEDRLGLSPDEDFGIGADVEEPAEDDEDDKDDDTEDEDGITEE